MIEFDNDLYIALNDYFTALNSTGYVPYTDVSCLLVYSYLLELLDKDILEELSIEDYNLIMYSIYILIEQSYLLKYPNYMKDRIQYNSES